ncbi:MAG TPA: DNA polymerase III subunit gamma/tau [Bacteroidales bacterium]|nr:DNA polymerase III subunit gamma/tau [Bacteroidales bacterium]HPT03327.1 DNA polymerase III subunit gamma/tau [Bacteroidales bacterium]
MENFVVSARKYRPVTFDSVVGQQAITGTLKNAIRNNQVAQAFLFCGPRGVGKTTCARILAKTINCQNLSPNLEPCNECDFCKAFNQSASFNINELDAASNNSVDDIRNLVDQVRIPPQMGKYKVYIIDEVHMLSQAAFNAFLKTLEEPPAYAKFILATTEKHKIIPTILSRCQIFDFKRITVDDIAKHLAWVAQSENVSAEPEALHIIAQKADGALRDALSMFDQMVSLGNHSITYKLVIDNLNVLDYEYYFRMTDYMLAGDIQQSLLLFNDIIDKGFEGQHFITGLGDHFRNLLMCRDASTAKLMETSENIRNRYLSQTKQCPIQFIISALEINNKSDVNYRTSNNKRLLAEVMLIQLCQLTGANRSSQSGAATVPAAAAPPSPEPVKPAEPEKAKTPVYPASPATEPAKAEESPAQATPTGEKPQPAEDNPAPPSALPDEELHTVTSGKPSGTRTVMPVSLSIKSAISQANQNAAKPEADHHRTSSFTDSQLAESWNTFAAGIKEESTLLYSALTGHLPVIGEGNVLNLELENRVLEAEFNRNKTDLITYLKNSLKNDFISIETSVSEQVTEVKKPYSEKEKFEQMAEKNPLIKTLRDQLDLGLDG